MACDSIVANVVLIPGPAGPRGYKGDTGDTGAVGPIGATGATGSPGAAGSPGADGSDGIDGSPGAPGVSAFTTTTAGFVQPAALGTVNVSVANTSWMAVGEPLFIPVGGSYVITAIPGATTVTVQNLGLSSNAAPATNITAGKLVTPSGFPGIDGTDGVTTEIDSFRAIKSINQAQVVGSPGTLVTFDIQSFDDDGVYDPTTSLWTCPETDRYQFIVQLLWGSAPGALGLALYKNGVPGAGGTLVTSGLVSSVRGLINTGPLALVVGDTVGVYSTQASGGAASIQALATATWFSGMRVTGAGSGGGGGSVQIYTGAAPPGSPADPSQASLFYPDMATPGDMQWWDVPTQQWH